VGKSEAALGLDRVMADLGHPQLLQIRLGLKLVDVSVPDDGVGRVGHRDILFASDPEAGVADRLRHAHERFDNHVHAEMVPLI